MFGHCRQSTKIYETWEARLKTSGPDEWPHKNEKFKNWSVEEKERVYDALESLPDLLLNGQVASLYRAEKSKDFPNPATSADQVIVLYDSAFKSKINLSRILAHELAHQAYREMSSSDKKEYGYSANWIPLDPEGRRYIGRKEGYVQDDGRGDPEEDFANNIEYFLFESAKLEKLTPQASRWIKQHYGDRFKLGKGGNK